MSAADDYGFDFPNMGMVLDGTKCGDEKICFQNQCRDMHSVVNVKKCQPIDCSGHGVSRNHISRSNLLDYRY